jgi:hypothetical protein
VDLKTFLLLDKGTLLAAIVLAFVGALIKFFLDDRQDRAHMRVQRLQDQVEHFYGPLFSIVDQLDTAFNVERRIIKDNPMSPDSLQTVQRFMFSEVYMPLHQQIRDVLLSRLYLIDGMFVPDSFRDYLAHSTQYEVQARLWFEHGISSDKTIGRPYPSRFNPDIEMGLDEVFRRLGVDLRALGDKPSEFSIPERRTQLG